MHNAPDLVAPPAPRRAPRSPTLADTRTALAVHVLARVLGLVGLFVVDALTNHSAHLSLLRWDARWYARIAETGYGHEHVAADGRMLTDYAFFPLYPALERGVAEVTARAPLDAGLLISAVSSLVAAVGIFRVGSLMVDARTGVVLVALWSTLPIAVVQSMAYPESLYTALVAWSLHAVLRHRYGVAGLLASLAGLTHPMGATLAAAVIVAAWLRLRTTARQDAGVGSDPDPVHRGRVGSPVIGGVVAPLGTVAYLGYVAVKERDPLAYFHVAAQWGNHFDGGISLARWIGHLLSGGNVLAGVLVTIAFAVLLLQVWWMLWDRYPLPVVVFTVLSVAVTVSMSGYFGSQPRHLLPVFPLLIPLAVWLGRGPTRRVRAVIAGLGLMSAGYGPIWLFGPGPP